jgi:hypothetical protein
MNHFVVWGVIETLAGASRGGLSASLTARATNETFTAAVTLGRRRSVR